MRSVDDPSSLTPDERFFEATTILAVRFPRPTCVGNTDQDEEINPAQADYDLRFLQFVRINWPG